MTNITPRLIDQQNRVALPKEVLEALQVSKGEHVTFQIENGKVTLHKVAWKAIP